MDFSAEARLAHAGTERTAGAPLAPPLLATSTYVSQGEPDPERGYGRMANPGWTAVEEALAAIEGPGAVAVSFASGQAASMALMLSLGAGRSRIVFPHDGYYNTRALADRLRPHGAEAVVADQLDLAAVGQALRARPSVLWAETPTNPLLRVADLSALGELAAATAAPFVVDNTVATALLQKPLEFGALASVYSLTKAISGHSDVLGGAVVTRDEDLARDLRDWRTAGGGIPGPFESWLVLRGMKTLDLRITRAVRERPRDRRLPGGPPARHGRPLPRAQAFGRGEGAAAQRLRPAAVVRASGHGRGRRRSGRRRSARGAGDQPRRRRVHLGAPRPLGGRNRPGDAHPPLRGHRTRRGPARGHRRGLERLTRAPSH